MKNKQASVNYISLYCITVNVIRTGADKCPLSLRLIYVISGRSRRSRDGRSLAVMSAEFRSVVVRVDARVNTLSTHSGEMSWW